MPKMPKRQMKNENMINTTPSCLEPAEMVSRMILTLAKVFMDTSKIIIRSNLPRNPGGERVFKVWLQEEWCASLCQLLLCGLSVDAVIIARRV